MRSGSRILTDTYGVDDAGEAIRVGAACLLCAANQSVRREYANWAKAHGAAPVRPRAGDVAQVIDALYGLFKCSAIPALAAVARTAARLLCLCSAVLWSGVRDDVVLNIGDPNRGLPNV